MAQGADVLGGYFLRKSLEEGGLCLQEPCPQSATLQTLLRILKFLSVTLWWTQSYIPFRNTRTLYLLRWLHKGEEGAKRQKKKNHIPTAKLPIPLTYLLVQGKYQRIIKPEGPLVAQFWRKLWAITSADGCTAEYQKQQGVCAQLTLILDTKIAMFQEHLHGSVS